jgi:hypothetical protein
MRPRILVSLAALLALQGFLLYPYLGSTSQDWDAVHVYLPMAQRLLAEGPAYFAQEASIHMPPFAYAWPALLGAKIGTVKAANFLLAGLTLLLIFRTASVLHSEAAGLAAAALFALCPTTRPLLATALSEPPFFLLTAAWIWALAEYFAGGRRRYLAVAAVALGLASLTRGSLFYLLPSLAAFFAWKRERPAAIAHLAALAFPLAFLVKNLALFSFPFFATGSGNALYLGTHPVTGGYDPIYLGLVFDTGMVTQGPAPLELASERLLAGIARMLLAETPPLQLLQLYAHKLLAFVFVSNAATDGPVALLRGWRIATLILGAIGLVAVRSTLLRWVIGLTLLYQVVVHVPVLYTHRYSVGALDLWLALLAGIGAWDLAERRDAPRIVSTALVMVPALAAGAWAWLLGPEPHVDVFRGRNTLVWEQRGLRGIGRMEVPIPQAPAFHPWANFALVIDVASECDSLRLSYKRDTDAGFSPAVTHRLADDGRVHRYQFGATVPLQLNAAGRLRIESACRIEMPRLAVYMPEPGLEWRERYLRRKD